MTETETEIWPDVMVTAHRKLPKGLVDEWLAGVLRDRIAKLRDEFGMERATTGLAIGGDTVWADIALEMGVPLHGAIPFPSQDAKWTKAQKAHYAELKERCATLEYVSETDPRSTGEAIRMLHARNDAMLSGTNAVVAIWAPANHTGGTFNCISKAVSAGLPVILVNIAARTVTRPSAARWAELLKAPALASAINRHQEGLGTRA